MSRTITNPAFTYRSSYTVEGRTLKMHREFISRVSGQTCPAELETQITEDIKLVALNMNNVFNFGGVASAAPAKQPQVVEAPRAAPSAAPKQPQTQEATRVVPSDQKRRIDFIY
jgi:hypothetical protein